MSTLHRDLFAQIFYFAFKTKWLMVTKEGQ